MGLFGMIYDSDSAPCVGFIGDLGHHDTSASDLTNDHSDPNATIEITRELIAGLDSDDETLPVHLSALNELLWDRFVAEGSMPDLREAYECDTRALELTRPGDPNLPDRLNALAVDLEMLSRYEDDPSLLERSISMGTEAVKATPSGDAYAIERHERKYNLAVALHGRYISQGDITDLMRALKELNEVLADCGGLTARLETDHIHELANIFHHLHEHHGGLEDLEKANELYHAALASAIDQRAHWKEPRIRSALARSLHSLYVAIGDGVHLEECIDHMDKALNATTLDSVFFADYQSYQGAFLCQLYRSTQRLKHLKKAIELERGSLQATSEEHPLLALRYANLGESMGILYERRQELSVGDEAVEMLQRALELGPGHPWAPWWKTKLVGVLLQRFSQQSTLR